MKRLYCDDLVRLSDYFERYHAGKERMIMIAEVPSCSVAGGPSVHPVDGPSSVYKVTVYEGRVTGKLRRAICIMDVGLGLYRSLQYYIDVEDGFYFGRLDGFVNTLVGRRRRLLALQAVINAD